MELLTKDSDIHIDVSNGPFTELGEVLLEKRKNKIKVIFVSGRITLWNNGKFSVTEAQVKKRIKISKYISAIFVIQNIHLKLANRPGKEMLYQ